MTEPTPQEWRLIHRLVEALQQRDVTSNEVKRAWAYWRQHRRPSWKALLTWADAMARSPWAGGDRARRRYKALAAVLREMPTFPEVSSPERLRWSLVLGAAFRLLQARKKGRGAKPEASRQTNDRRRRR